MEDAPNVVTGNFSIRTYPIEVLFDSSVTSLSISTRLVETLWLVLTPISVKHNPSRRKGAGLSGIIHRLSHSNPWS